MWKPFDIHNLFRKEISEFLKYDPHLAPLKNLKYAHTPSLIKEIPITLPGVYLLTGGRQVGKSTLLKLMIRRLVEKEQVDPRQIRYLPCDTLEHFQSLVVFLEAFEAEKDPARPFFLFIDEVTYVREWERAIKSLADRGFFKNGSALITGSDNVLLKEAMMMFPGRRGDADQTDFHLYPLSFFETVGLYEPEAAKGFQEARKGWCQTWEWPQSLPQNPSIDRLYSLWDSYLLTGGFITAINSHAVHGEITKSVYQTYIQWIFGDLLKRGKREDFAQDLLRGVMERLGSQITWHGLASEMPSGHHQTVAEYLSLLERMDVLQVCPALREDKGRAAPKKARKIHFGDPFIFHALHAWIWKRQDPFQWAGETLKEDRRLIGPLVEGAVSALARRNYEVFYIKAEGEVDIAIKDGRRVLPIEIKWSLSPQKRELKQIFKYKNGIVATKGRETGRWDQLTLVPIPLLALLFG